MSDNPYERRPLFSGFEDVDPLVVLRVPVIGGAVRVRREPYVVYAEFGEPCWVAEGGWWAYGGGVEVVVCDDEVGVFEGCGGDDVGFVGVRCGLG